MAPLHTLRPHDLINHNGLAIAYRPIQQTTTTTKTNKQPKQTTNQNNITLL